MGIASNYNENLKQRLAYEEGIIYSDLEKALNKGEMVILGNSHNTSLQDFKPTLVGGLASKKICVAIGMDSKSTGHFNEGELATILAAEPNVICDVSIGNNIPQALKKIRRTINIPLGSCPTYDIFVPTLKTKLCQEEILERIEEHLMSGVDFILLHFGINKKIFKNLSAAKRIMPSTSRGGGAIIHYMKKFSCENPLVTYADDIGKICKKYGAVLDLGDIFRPGCLEDGSHILDSDSLKVQETEFLSELRNGFIRQEVPVVCEGGGHIPLHLITKVSQWMKVTLNNAPIWYNGPLPTDRAVGFDSIANALGSCTCALSGGDMFLALTDAEHYTKPTPYQSAQAVRTMKVVISAVEYSRENNVEVLQNHKMGIARQERNWTSQVDNSLYPKITAKAFQQCGLTKNAKPCSLCGNLCPLLVFDYDNKE